MDTSDKKLLYKKNGSDGYIGPIFSYIKKNGPMDTTDPYLVI